MCVDTSDIPEGRRRQPDMMASMPVGLTAATGMDAPHHAMGLHHQRVHRTLGHVPPSEPSCHHLSFLREAVAEARIRSRVGPREMALGQYIADGLLQCWSGHRALHGAHAFGTMTPRTAWPA